MQVQANIQELFMVSIERLNTLRDSLQAEFEFFAGSADVNVKDSPAEKKIRAKKKQQDILNEIKNLNSQLSDQIEILNEKIFNLEACLFNYGVSPAEVLFFINQSKSGIENTIRTYICENIFQVPENFASMVNWKEQSERMLQHLNADLDKIAATKPKPQPAAIRFTKVPTLDWSGLQTKQLTDKKTAA